jgi:pyruvate dehydrogenase E2 component (dihydrolipoamide acetyltransferase)
VIKNADQKGLFELARELEDLSARARTRKLTPGDLQGGTFSISSLGGIGGSFFTPIVNHPEVAILGVSKMEWKPVYQGNQFVPRLLLPLSLSYDHRVIDGADAVRFTTRLAQLLADLRLLLV